MAIGLLAANYLAALEIEPWIPQPWEFHFVPTYTYSRYPTVSQAHPQLASPSNDHVIDLAMGVAPTQSSFFDVEIEFADTPRQAMGYRSLAAQYRFAFSNEMDGDCASITSGASLRGVALRSLHDVSCPYAANFNFELNTAIGKEWNRGWDWLVRIYGWGAVGIANHGSPWVRFITSIAGHPYRNHRFEMFVTGDFGFGKHHQVSTDHFYGYASIYHQSIDLSALYGYEFEIWGTIKITYTRRLYAFCFPQLVNFFTISYNLPFSFF